MPTILNETTCQYSMSSAKHYDLHEDVVNTICKSVQNERKDSIAQPHAIIGETGSGKTHLLKTIACQNEQYYTCVYIDGKSLFSTNDIIKHTSIHSSRVLLLIDNIDYYFYRTDKSEHYKLRSMLSEQGAPILVGSASTVLPEFSSYDAAFFDGIKLSYIKSLKVETIYEVVGNNYDRQRIDNLLKYLPSTIRTAFLIKEILTKSNNNEADLTLLVDYYHTYYKAKYDTSLVQVQRIMNALSSSNEGMTLQNIREITGQDNGKISPYMKTMLDNKLIKKDATGIRGGKYSIVDPLFQEWIKYNS